MIDLQQTGWLFDLDGVIIDSETEYSRIWGDIEALFPTGVENFPRRIKGTTLPNILSTYFNPKDFEAITAELSRRESLMEYDYCPFARELLDFLKERNLPIAIVTSSMDDKMMKLRIRHPELFDIVDVIVDASCKVKSKPSPEGYLLGARKIGKSPEMCVVVEDSVQGMRAGKAAGAFVVGLTGTFGRENVEGEADIVIDSLDELDIDRVLTMMEGE